MSQKPIPIAVVNVHEDQKQTFRLDGETQMAFIEEVADQILLDEQQRSWLHNSVDFKTVYADGEPTVDEAIASIRKYLDEYPDWQMRIPSGLVGRLRMLLGEY